jgi:predicted nucleic acid-binding protein
MKKQKIYLETSAFGRYFEADRSHHKDTIALFEVCAAGRFEPYTSGYVVKELRNAPIEIRDKMLELIDTYNITVFGTSADAENLANMYISKGALPKKSHVDAIHIAIASVSNLDIIVSLNFRHIVREKTIKLINTTNIVLGYKTVKIQSPMEVMKNEQ